MDCLQTFSRKREGLRKNRELQQHQQPLIVPNQLGNPFGRGRGRGRGRGWRSSVVSCVSISARARVRVCARVLVCVWCARAGVCVWRTLRSSAASTDSSPWRLSPRRAQMLSWDATGSIKAECDGFGGACWPPDPGRSQISSQKGVTLLSGHYISVNIATALCCCVSIEAAIVNFFGGSAHSYRW